MKIKFNAGQNEISKVYSNNTFINQATNGKISFPNTEELNPRQKLLVRADAEIRQLILTFSKNWDMWTITCKWVIVDMYLNLMIINGKYSCINCMFGLFGLQM